MVETQGSFPDGAAAGLDRIRRAGMTGATSALLQVLVIVVGLVSVPLTISYLGRERYGVWLTLSSMLTWLSLSDMGMGGNALINALSEAAGREDPAWQRELVATAFWGLSAIAASLGMFLALPWVYIPWTRLFNVSGQVDPHELNAAVIVSCVCFLLEFPLRSSVGAYYGNQEGYISNIWSIVGAICSLVALLLVTRVVGGLALLAAALWGTRVLVSGVAAAYLFLWHRPALLPVPTGVSWRASRRLARLGWRYIVGQFGSMGMTQSQPFILAQIAGPGAVAIFNVAQRVALLPSSFVQVFLNPLMPAYSEARARGEWSWIHRTFRHSTSAAVGASVLLAIVTGVALRPVVRVWLGETMQPTPALAWLLSGYVLVAGAIAPCSVLLYGMERIGRQAKIALANATALIVLGIAFTMFWGPSGLAAAMLVAAIVTNLPGQVLEIRSALKGTGR